MAVNPSIKVGILVVLAALLFLAAYFFLNANVRNAYTVTVIFRDIMGMTEGSPVNMAGVPIGSVKKIYLTADLKAAADLNINKKFMIPKGSRFLLRVGVLIGEKFIDVIPNRKSRIYIPENSVIFGETPTRFEDLVPTAQKLLTNLTNASEKILPKTEELISNLTDVSEDLKDLLSDDNLKGRIDRSFNNIEQSTAILENTMRSLQGIIVSNEDELQTILRNTALASEDFRTAAQSLADFAQTGEFQGSLTQTLASARNAAASLERTVTSLENLVTSPELQGDVRATASSARRAIEEAERILNRVGGILGTGRPRTEGQQRSKLPTRETTIDSLLRPDDGRFRATLSTSLLYGNDRFLNLGLYDIGAGNKIIIQPGQSLSANTDFRYGIYASRLGLGLDHAFSRKAYGTLNLYDPYEPKLDLQTGYNVTDDW
ncbi:MAG: MlaD family protein, partial [Armatimonadota bacterium]